MAPERPKTLTVLDYTLSDGGLHVQVHRWDPKTAASELVVIWTETANAGHGFYRIADGAVWVAVPPGYDWGTYESIPKPGELTWSDATIAGGTSWLSRFCRRLHARRRS